MKLQQGDQGIVAYIQEPPTEMMFGKAKYSG
jgi:hypothetical protein